MFASWSAISTRPGSSSPEAGRTVRLQDFTIRVIGPPEVLEELGGLFPAPFVATAEGAGACTTHLEVRAHPALPDRFQLIRDDALLWEAASRDELLPLLEWAIATAGVEHLGRRYLLFHAGAVSRNRQGLLLPGRSGSGKSTLVAGLLRAGFRYLSDEVAVVDPTLGHLLPFAKSVCVKAGAQAVLAPLWPQLASADWRHRFGPELVAFLPPPVGSWSSGPARLRFVVLPRYLEGAETRLVRIPRSVAATVLLEQSFNARAVGPAAVIRTLELLRGAECFALTTGELSSAVRLLRELGPD